MNRSARRFGPLGWVGVLLCGLAAIVVLVLAVSTHRAASGPSVRLGDGPQHVVLPAESTYGIYVNDANNSGYTESCSATDAHGNTIQMRNPPLNFTRSNTETLDMVYNTGSGHLTINCSVPGEIVTTRPVTNYSVLLLVGLAAAAMAVVGIVLVIIRLARAPSVAPELPHRQIVRG